MFDAHVQQAPPKRDSDARVSPDDDIDEADVIIAHDERSDCFRPPRWRQRRSFAYAAMLFISLHDAMAEMMMPVCFADAAG